MPKATKEFKYFLDAVEDILSGKPVDDLDERISNWSSTDKGSVRLFIEAKRFIPWSRYENRILQGEDPRDVYGVSDSEESKEWQQKAQKFLRDILDKYR